MVLQFVTQYESIDAPVLDIPNCIFLEGSYYILRVEWTIAAISYAYANINLTKGSE